MNTIVNISSALKTVGGGLTITVDSTIHGSVQRVIMYNASTFCRESSKVFFTEPRLSPGSPTQFDVGGFYPTGTELLVTVEGIDSVAAYTFYTTVTVLAP